MHLFIKFLRIIKLIINLLTIKNFIFFFLFFYIYNYIVIDAEFYISLAVFLFILLIWGGVSQFLYKFLYIKVVAYYYYFLQFYNNKLWYIFLLISFFKLDFLINKLSIILKWLLYTSIKFINVFKKLLTYIIIFWNKNLKFYFFILFFNVIKFVWNKFINLSYNKFLLNFQLNFSKKIKNINLKKIINFILFFKTKFLLKI